MGGADIAKVETEARLYSGGGRLCILRPVRLNPRIFST